jgi:low temperature requirement protein LtrA
MSVSDAERSMERDEHEVTPLELFFDLTFVFAMTQVTILLADDRTWGGVFRGMLVLAALTLVSTVCSLVVAYEVLRYRTARVRVRHPELAA